MGGAAQTCRHDGRMCATPVRGRKMWADGDVQCVALGGQYMDVSDN